MKIKAAVVEEHGAPFTFKELEIADPREDEILVRVVSSGLCGTDEHARLGHIPVRTPIVLGHEGAGIVEKVGSAVTDIAVGDHVVMSFGACFECKHCEEMGPYACDDWKKVNFGGRMLDGYTPLKTEDGEEVNDFFAQSSCATYAVCKANQAAVIDPDFDLEIAGPLACGIQTGCGIVMNTLKMQENPSPQSFAVYGCGSVGMAALMAAKICGADPIIAIGGSEKKLALAKELGATHVINRKEVDNLEDAVRAICPQGVENAVETSGNATMALTMLHTGSFLGKCVNAGASRLDSWHFPSELGSKSLYGVSMGWSNPKTFIPYLAELYKEGKLPYDKIITKFPFSEINEVAKASAAGEIIKGVIIMDK